MDIWEKGNIGLTDLSSKLHICLKQALCDYLLELYFLPQPIARMDDMVHSDDSPTVNSPFVVLEPSPPLRRASQDSPRRSLFEKGEIRVPSSLGLQTQQSQEVGGVSLPDTPAGPEPHRSQRCDTISVATAMEEAIWSPDMAEVDLETFDNPTETAALSGEAAASSGGLTWHEKEKSRREVEALGAYQKEAHHGKRGVLETTYSSLIPQHFAATSKLASRSLAHYTFPILGSYSAEVFLNESLSFCSQICPDLSLSTFKLGPNGEYLHHVPQKTSRTRDFVDVEETFFVVVGRNLRQWDEVHCPDDAEIRLTQVCVCVRERVCECVCERESV